jgi:signal transduction histidine kinase
LPEINLQTYLPAANLRTLISKLSNKNYLFTSIYISLLMLVLLIFGQHSLSLWLENLSYKEFEKITHTLIVAKDGERLLNTVIDSKRSRLEGYYQQELFVFDDTLNRLYQLLNDNSSQTRQLNKIKYLYNQWQSKFGLEKAVEPITLSSEREEPLFNALLTQINNLIVYEENLLSERKNFVKNLHNINIFINTFSAVVILLVVGFNIQLLHRRAKVPLHNLTNVSKLWREGKMEVQLGYSSGDEVGELAAVLDEMTNQIHQRQTSIQEHSQHLEDLICALSHDLRTPILATRSTLDSMLSPLLSLSGYSE